MWSRGHILAPLVMALYGTGPFSAPTPRRCPDHILSLLVSAFNRGPVWVVVTKGAQGADRVGSLYSRFLERRYQGRDILNKGSQTKLHPDTNLDQAEWFWPAQDSDTFDTRWNYLRQANGPIPDLPYHLDQISSPPNIRPVVTLHERRVSGLGYVRSKYRIDKDSEDSLSESVNHFLILTLIKVNLC